MEKMRRHLIAIVVLAVAFAAVGGAPASADPPADVEGVLVLGDDLEPFPIGGEVPGAPCEASAAVDVDFDGGGTYTMTASAKIPFQIYTGPTWYQLDLSLLLLTNATWTANGSPPPDFTLTGSYIWQMTFSLLDTSTCAKESLCVVRFRALLIPPSGHDGSLPTPGAGDVTTLSSSTEVAGGIRPTVVAGSCPAVISAWMVGQPATLDLALSW